MFQLLSLVFNIIKFFFPFLHEVTRPENIKDEEDRTKALLLRSAIKSFVWKVILILAMVFIVTYYTIPLYSENLSLKRELVILRDENKSKNSITMHAQHKFNEQQVVLKDRELQIERLSNALRDKVDSLIRCNDELNEYKKRGKLIYADKKTIERLNNIK